MEPYHKAWEGKSFAGREYESKHKLYFDINFTALSLKPEGLAKTVVGEHMERLFAQTLSYGVYSFHSPIIS